MAEVGHIIDVLGDVDYQDPDTGVIYVKNPQTGKTLKVADLVNDEPKEREKYQLICVPMRWMILMLLISLSL